MAAACQRSQRWRSLQQAWRGSRQSWQRNSVADFSALPTSTYTSAMLLQAHPCCLTAMPPPAGCHSSLTDCDGDGQVGVRPIAVHVAPKHDEAIDAGIQVAGQLPGAAAIVGDGSRLALLGPGAAGGVDKVGAQPEGGVRCERRARGGGARWDVVSIAVMITLRKLKRVAGWDVVSFAGVITPRRLKRVAHSDLCHPCPASLCLLLPPDLTWV